MREELVAVLEEALGPGDTMLIVRSAGAIAEVAGGRPRRGEEWLTLGDEGAGASHVHLRLSAIRGLRYRHSEGGNAALAVVGPDGGVILSVSFRRTNPARVDGFDAGRLAALRARFERFADAAP